jgi:hypothetical protein
VAFKKGTSGNPKGRTPGQETRASRLRKAIEARADELLEAAIALALAGDVQALRMLLDKIIPSLKSRDLPVSIKLDPEAALPAQGRQILGAVAEGKLNISDGTALLTGLAAQSRLIEISELTERIERLEESQCR